LTNADRELELSIPVATLGRELGAREQRIELHRAITQSLHDLAQGRFQLRLVVDTVRDRLEIRLGLLVRGTKRRKDFRCGRQTGACRHLRLGEGSDPAHAECEDETCPGAHGSNLRELA
jgi:hypothetical protein